MNYKALARTLLSRFLLLLLIIVGLIPMLVMMLMPEKWRYRNRTLFWFIDLFYWLALKFSFIPLTIVGQEHIPKEPVVFAANHQSSLDIPLLGLLTHGKPHIWLARSELMNTFFLRWILPRLAQVVDVKSGTKAMRSLMSIMRLVEESDIDVMIFPEGSRHIDGSVHEFFGGFVILAKVLQRPVVPVRIFGANKVYPPNSFIVESHPVKVVVGKPMIQQESETDEQFKQRVYEWFIEQTEN